VKQARSKWNCSSRHDPEEWEPVFSLATNPNAFAKEDHALTENQSAIAIRSKTTAL